MRLVEYFALFSPKVDPACTVSSQLYSAFRRNLEVKIFDNFGWLQVWPDNCLFTKMNGMVCYKFVSQTPNNFLLWKLKFSTVKLKPEAVFYWESESKSKSRENLVIFTSKILCKVLYLSRKLAVVFDYCKNSMEILRKSPFLGHYHNRYFNKQLWGDNCTYHTHHALSWG